MAPLRRMQQKAMQLRPVLNWTTTNTTGFLRPESMLSCPYLAL